MLENAISRLRAEMGENNGNPYIQVVGQFLLSHLGISPGAAEKIMNTEKTIKKSLDEMKKAAEKKKVGNCAVLTDQEGFDIVLKYFGIDGSVSTAQMNTNPVEVKRVEPTEQKSKVDFDIKLEDLL